MRAIGTAVDGYGRSITGGKQPDLNISKLINNFEKSTGF
jgi:hypothetical protein